MEIEKKRNFIIRFCWLALVCLIIYILVKLLGNLLLPFVVGFVIAAVIKTPVEFISRKLHIKKNILSAVILTLLYLLCLLILLVSGNELYEFVVRQIENAPTVYSEKIAPIINTVIAKLEMMFPHLEDMFNIQVDTLISESMSIVTTLAANLLQRVTGAVTSLPSIIMDITFAIAASYFFALDYNNVIKAFLRQFSSEIGDKMIRAKNSAFQTVKEYCRVYGIIILCTFTELIIGFSIIRVNNMFWIALVIALIDILPIVGTGTFLIPWGVILCLMGDFGRGIGMLLLYLIITVIRQVLEPKIVGKRIGLSPVITLFGIYLGGKIMGIFGIIILPMSFAVIKNWNDEGIIKLYK